MVELGQQVKFNYNISIQGHRYTLKANGVVVEIIPKNNIQLIRVKIDNGSYNDDRDNEVSEAIISPNQIIMNGGIQHKKSKKMKKNYRKKTYRKRHK